MDNRFAKVSRQLESYHAIFAKIWQVGRVNWTDKIPTAAVSFNSKGNYISFLFNEEFYNSLNEEELCAVIVHECLHVLLNHGIRGKGLHPELANIAMDAVINDMLINKYGFDPKLPLFEKLVFRHKLEEQFGPLEVGREFEYYYQKLLSSPNLKWEFGSMDSHDWLPTETMGDIERSINKLSDEEKERLSALGKELADAQKPGTGSSTDWRRVTLVPAGKVAWKQMMAKAMYNSFATKKSYQWRLPDRRFSMLPKDMLIPQQGDVAGDEKIKVDTVFFMDVSGSCHSLVPTFLSEAKRIPKEQFAVEAYAFDTKVEKISIFAKDIPFGGGTSFEQLEELLCKRDRYPEVVFVMTDGDGTAVSPKYPSRWNILLTKGGRRHCFAEGCRFIECF